MQARIFKPTKSTMQSGESNQQKWILEFQTDEIFIEPLTGRTSCRNMKNEVRLEFDSKEQAEVFANKRNYNYEIIEAKKPKLIKKSYADNFK